MKPNIIFRNMVGEELVTDYWMDLSEEAIQEYCNDMEFCVEEVMDIDDGFCVVYVTEAK